MMPYLVDPGSVLTWSHDWTDWLAYGSPSDTIASRLWTISPQEGSPLQPALSNTTQAIVTAQGFLAGRVYHLTERIVTDGGLADERTIILRCDNT